MSLDSPNCYATDKVIYHPRIVQSFMAHCSHEMYPVFVHLMPQNFCNQNCEFCSYRMSDWKNSTNFDRRSHIPWERLQKLLHELNGIGVKAVEITGGGEPLAYPDIKRLFDELSMMPIETALVTNGTLLKEHTVDLLFSTHLQWVRVSVDAGNKKNYCTIRRCPELHWDLAWKGIGRLVARQTYHTIGIGFVVTQHNYMDILELCSRAKDAGVDNVRISVAFTSKGADILNQSQKREARNQLDKVGHLNCSSFRVVDLFDERLTNLRLSSKKQNYEYCGTKDLLCVIEGEGNVYTCCTLTGIKAGLIGNIMKQPFGELWKAKTKWRENFDPRKICKCTCLYEKRNQVMLGLRNPPGHINFI